MFLEKGAMIGFEEDRHNEFKMHTKMSLFELPRSCCAIEFGRRVRTTQPNSKTISAFLNSGGGKIFLGVDDSGIMEGIFLNKVTKDHFILALHKCLRQFTPKVPANLIKVQYIKLATENHEDWLQHEECECDKCFQERKLVDMTVSHLVGGYYCHSCRPIERSHSFPYIIVVTVGDGGGTIYQNEEGLAYYRRSNSNRMFCANDRVQWNRTKFITSGINKESNSTTKSAFLRIFNQLYGYLLSV